MIRDTSNPAYYKILSQNGLENFKLLIKKWEALSKNILEKPSGVPIILPDIFLVSHEGTGRTYLLKLLSEYLSEKKNLMDFYGDVKYFEFMLNYCEPNEYFSEIKRLMQEVDNAAGFRSEYRGIVYIDIDEWVEHFEEKHFRDFMEYVSDNSDDWLIVLSVSDSKKDEIAKMEKFISMYLRTEKVIIELPTTEEFLQYTLDMLYAYGISLDRGAEGLILESIGALCNNKYFDGYKTIKMLCEDIAYETYISGYNRINALSANSIIKFKKDGDYIKRMIVKIEKTNKIGFC